MAQEVARLNTRGYYDGLGGGTYIGRAFLISLYLLLILVERTSTYSQLRTTCIAQ